MLNETRMDSHLIARSPKLPKRLYMNSQSTQEEIGRRERRVVVECENMSFPELSEGKGPETETLTNIHYVSTHTHTHTHTHTDTHRHVCICTQTQKNIWKLKPILKTSLVGPNSFFT